MIAFLLISADDMGLGKTLTMIALVLKCKEEQENNGGEVNNSDPEDENSSLHSRRQKCNY